MRELKGAEIGREVLGMISVTNRRMSVEKKDLAVVLGGGNKKVVRVSQVFGGHINGESCTKSSLSLASNYLARRTKVKAGTTTLLFAREFQLFGIQEKRSKQVEQRCWPHGGVILWLSHLRKCVNAVC